MITGASTGNGIPHDRYNIRGIAHAATNKKDKIFMQRRLYIDENTSRWTYSALRYFNLRIQNMEARWPICLIQALNSCLIWFWEQSCFCPPLLNCFFWKTIILRVLEIEYFSDNRQLINIGLMFSMISPFSDLIHIVGCQKDTSYYQ